ncbi:hypothetical protein JCM8202v2_000396 [Rhodotorula sphaerocarpa]
MAGQKVPAAPGGAVPAAVVDDSAAFTSKVKTHDLGDNATSDATAPPPKKRKPNRGARGLAKRGTGAGSSLPLELVREICTYLEPADLYALSKTSKTFRAVVTEPASEQLWSDARDRVGLPDLEEPMSDAHWAALLFRRRGCWICEEPKTTKIDVFNRLRACRDCDKTRFANPETEKGQKMIQGVLPDPHPFTLEIATHPDHLVELDGDLKEKCPDAAPADRLFILEKKAAAKGRAPEPMPQSPFQHWLNDEVWPLLFPDRHDGRALWHWVHDRERWKKFSLRAQRRDDFERRLKALGFNRDDFTMGWEKEPIVKKAELLTERAWAKIGPVLQRKLLDRRRTNRLHHIEARFENVISASPERPLFYYVKPTAAMARFLPTVLRLVHDDPSETPAKVLLRRHKEAILDEVAALIRSHFHAMVRRIAAVYNEVRDAQDAAAASASGARYLTDPAVEHLSASEVILPRLPSWIPRDPRAPIKASDLQLVTLLQSHDLATFACRECTGLFDGISAIIHLTNEGYGAWTVETSDDWSPPGASPSQSESQGLMLDATIMLRALKLKQLARGLEMTNRDRLLDLRAAYYLQTPVPEEDKYTARYSCRCGCHVASFRFRRVPDMIENHAERFSRKVELSASLEYSPTYINQINKAFREALKEHLDGPNADVHDIIGQFSDDSQDDEELPPEEDVFVEWDRERALDRFYYSLYDVEGYASEDMSSDEIHAIADAIDPPEPEP